MTSQYQQVLAEVMPFYGQRVQVINTAWEICKKRYGYEGELTGVVTGFICDEDGITLAVQHDSNHPKTWGGETDMYFMHQVEILTLPCELVTA